MARIASVWFFLEAFHIEATAETVVAVLAVQSLSTLLPFTPGGAGTQQAVLVFALGGAASPSAILSFSVGMQVATVVANVVLGFGAIAVMLRTLSWRRHVEAERGLATPEEPGGPAPRVRATSASCSRVNGFEIRPSTIPSPIGPLALPVKNAIGSSG